MKKFITLFVIITLFSCSSSDDNNSQKSDLNPPAWIQGTWIQEGGTISHGVGFKFSENDFCTLNSSTQQCQQGMIDLYRKGGKNPTVEETFTNASYTAVINYAGGQSVTYSFNKLSNTEIEWTAASGVIFNKQ
jgi:hypothetical protein